MTGGEHAVIVVHSTSHAMKISKHLKKRGLEWKLIPVPRHISSDCGVCVRILRTDADAARQVVDDLAMDIAGIEEI